MTGSRLRTTFRAGGPGDSGEGLPPFLLFNIWYIGGLSYWRIGGLVWSVVQLMGNWFGQWFVCSGSKRCEPQGLSGLLRWCFIYQAVRISARGGLCALLYCVSLLGYRGGNLGIGTFAHHHIASRSASCDRAGVWSRCSTGCGFRKRAPRELLCSQATYGKPRM
jgi:hypothetical protein